MNNVLKQDIEEFVNTFELSNDLTNAVFLITGATGLIGSTLIHCLLAIGQNTQIIAPIRNKDKAYLIFQKETAKIKLIECDLLTFDYDSVGSVDYVIHCAAPTSSKFFVEYPVETFNTIYQGTDILLRYAQRHKVKSFVYLSSLEVYGSIHDDSLSITENVQGYIDPTNIRSSYPMAKRATENLCCLYASEYNIPVKIARLTQTTGAGISKNDSRVIAQFARLAAKGKNIVLHTTGESARSYCYTTDAISAILYILVRGEAGMAYNVANENTYISVRSMAEFLKTNINPKISINIEQQDNMGYAPMTKLRLDTEKLMALGWRPKYDLKDIFEKLVKYLLEDENKQ